MKGLFITTIIALAVASLYAKTTLKCHNQNSHSWENVGQIIVK